MTKKIIIFISIIVIAIFAVAGYYGFRIILTPNAENPETPELNIQYNGQTACTQEAMQCPDGTYVGRTGPNCEFAACSGGETAGWYIYESPGKLYKFTFQYPYNWQIDEMGDNVYLEKNGVRLAKFSAGFLVNSDWGDNGVKLNEGFDTSWNFWQRNIEEAEKNPNQPWPAFLHDYVSENWTILSKKEINFLGKESLQIEFQDAKKIAKSTMILTPYLDTDAVYNIEMFNYFNKTEIEEIFTQILSTFKFTK
ncbi:MAG: hypothetical protein CO001_02060 [Candidatus Portnoybacteria bacterium CG_4_8_14_3_um_filter_40_10]|uniref:Uncharacterized protein n=2 Tax=Candidatus Portnoyibacteriota TaxID=1817913 RepID=A0A2M7IIH3_9BACT|nr:MAG: hypothetical protein COV84_01155 [Candidatus Portnoybacteria bacterium CG11_big_fil_rev_8_21_14_0_20_40_15]PIW76305.1 MAG: hypothetical protein CO001_02060 [Candidatus Portnoybacteria bacterium CG_4_8_14_3_um_filter_40_10]